MLGVRGLAGVLLALALGCGSASSPATIHPGELTWLLGQWRSEAGHFDEHWQMEGEHFVGWGERASGTGTPEVFERMTLRRIAGVWTLEATPRGQAPVRFMMVRLHGREVVFENPSHDDPQRIRYRRKHNTLIARVERLDGENARTIRMTYQR
jgi:hypothetical protein